MLEDAKKVEDFIIKFREEMHENPELSGKETRTSQRLREELDKMGVSYRTVKDSTSIIATIKGNKTGKTVALRGDIDALPIKEMSGVSFASKNEGVMHACGHDAHMSMLLGAVKILNEKKDEINGEVRFFFQESEEVFGGAKKIIADGGMDGVDAIFGMHGMVNIETGQANVEAGYRLSGADTIYVKFEGVSGHGSSPHLAKDTIHPACLFVTDLQSIITKNIDPQEPVVITVGKFIGGTKANIISKFTDLDMSMRYFNPKAREIAHEAIKRHAKHIADMWKIKVDVIIEESTLSTGNDPKMAKLANETIEKVMGSGKNIPMGRQMASEDFSYYLQKAKGAYLFMGYKNEEKGTIYPPHHEKFKIDEDYMKYGTAMFAQLALDFLNSKEE